MNWAFIISYMGEFVWHVCKFSCTLICLLSILLFPLMSSETVVYDIRDAMSGLACGVLLAESNRQNDLQKYPYSVLTELKIPETLSASSTDILRT